MRQLDRTIERINLAAVRFGIFEDADDNAALIFTGDRRVPPTCEWRVHDPLADHRGQVEQPFGKIRRPYVGDVEPGPVENLFGQPMLASRMALGVGLGV